MKRIRHIALLFFVVHGIYAQQINLLEKVRSNYANSKTFKMDVSLQLTMTSSYQGPPIQSSGVVIKEGNNYYSRIMGLTQIATDKYQLIIDESKKVILVQDRVPADYFQQFNVQILSGEKLLDLYDFSFEKAKKAVVITVIPKKKGEYKQMRIKIDSKKFYLLEVHSDYNIENNQAESSHIYYSNISFNQKIDQDYFRIEKYVRIKSKKNVIAVEDYKSYQIVNYLKN